MRAGVSTVQQTLTTEAANVLKLSVAEAQRRGHAQVTPLHVATTLLTGSSSVLRQACIQSHLHISQPPQCRGLELCFNVALDRLQTTTTSSSSNGHSAGGGIHQQQPALSNALVAALKRAQAHQRRGYPEQQQVPLLAVKVEMEQLIISILDDPSVSRVMREAGFTSTQVKSSLEEALGAAAAAAASAGSSSQQPRILPPGAGGSVDRLRLKLGSFEQLGLKLGGVGSLLDSCSEQYAPSSSSSSCLPFLQSRHHHHMPGLLLHERSNGFRSNAHHPQQQQQQQQQPGNVLLAMRMGSSNNRSSSGHEIEAGRRSQDAARVMEIFLKPRKRNPLLIGEQPPHGVIEEVIQRLDKGECDASLRNTRLLSPQFASIALGLHGKEEVEHKLGELGRAVDECVRSAGGAVVFLGDLQWLVERPPPPPPQSPPPSAGTSSSAYCPVQHAVSEIGRMMLNGNRVWLMGVASSQTYMRCQARHPSLEMLWGLQPLPISTAFSLRLRGSSTSRFLDGKANGTPAAPNDVDASPLRAAPIRWPLLPFNFSCSSAEDGLENCCPDCTAKYEQELVLLQEQEKDISSHDERTSNALPFWLKPNKDTPQQANGRVQKMKELQRRWSQTCHNLHGPLRSASYASVVASNGKVRTSTSGSLPMSIPWLSLQSAGTKGIATPSQVPEKNGLTVNGHGKDVGSVCTSSIDDVLSTQIGLSLKPPVRTTHEQQQQQESEVAVQTDLVLGRSKSSSNGSVTNGKLNNFFHRERVEGLSGCTPSSFGFPRIGPCPLPVSEKRYPAFIHEKLERTERQVPAAAAGNSQTFKPNELDFKGLCRALAESVPWQREAIDSIASTVLHCRSGVEKRRGANLKCDAWLLFLGSDIMAKRKVARILAEQVFGCEKMFFRMSLRSQAERRQCRGQEQDSEAIAGGPAGRGRTPLDRVAEAVRAKPFSVVLLEDIEQADSRLKNALMKAMDSGRLADSSGREVSVANLIVVMTSSLGENFLPKESSFKALDLSEKRLASAEIVGMKLLVGEPANTGAVLHKSERVAITVNNKSRILFPAENTSEEELQNGLHSKRKAGSTDLLDTAPEKRNKVEARGMEFDLNMPVEEEQVAVKVHPEEVVTSKDGSPVKQFISEESPVQQLLHKAFEQLSEGFCHRVNATIVFRPFDFDKLAELVLLEINSTVSATALPVEVESSVFEHLVAVLWEGQGRNQEFQRWVPQALGTSISSLIEKLKPTSEHVIKLVADKSDSTAEPVLHLPRTIRIGDEEP